MRGLLVLAFSFCFIVNAVAESQAGSTEVFPDYVQEYMRKMYNKDNTIPNVYDMDRKQAINSRELPRNLLQNPGFSTKKAGDKFGSGTSSPFIRYRFPDESKYAKKSDYMVEFSDPMYSVEKNPTTILIPNENYSILFDKNGNGTIVSKNPDGNIVAIDICKYFPWVCEEISAPK